MQHKSPWFVGLVHFIRTALPVVVVSFLARLFFGSSSFFILLAFLLVVIVLIISFRLSITYIVKKYVITDPRAVGAIFAAYYVSLFFINTLIVSSKSFAPTDLFGVALAYVILYESTRTMLSKRLGIKTSFI